MRKLLRYAIVASSLILCLGAAALWVRTGWLSDSVNAQLPEDVREGVRVRDLTFESSWGSLTVKYRAIAHQIEGAENKASILAYPPARAIRHNAREPRWSEYWPPSGSPRTSLRGRWGFYWITTSYSFGALSIAAMKSPSIDSPGIPSTYHETIAIVPLWCLVLLFGFLPLRALWRWTRSRRPGPGCCGRCGYDLRSTADGTGPLLATCPECGRTTAKAS